MRGMSCCNTASSSAHAKILLDGVEQYLRCDVFTIPENDIEPASARLAMLLQVSWTDPLTVRKSEVLRA